MKYTNHIKLFLGSMALALMFSALILLNGVMKPEISNTHEQMLIHMEHELKETKEFNKQILDELKKYRLELGEVDSDNFKI